MVQVSPDNDVYGSYGVEPGMKRYPSSMPSPGPCLYIAARYNHSCEEYDSLATPGADPFVRICPLGVKSCFYITGKYGDQSGFLQFLNFAIDTCINVQS